jgi:hypothetical protein
LTNRTSIVNKKSDDLGWLLYERCAAAFASEAYGGDGATVTPNASIVGTISKVRRQVDVLIDARWDSAEGRIIIDAKRRSRKINIGDVDQFEGMMRDCAANRGVLVCSRGYTVGARRRAQDAISIEILDLKEARKFEWEYEPCLATCVVEQNELHLRRGMVLWGEYVAFDVSELWMIVQTGKCDGCHAFHVWCWDCGAKFAVADGCVETCGCNREWGASPTVYTREGDSLPMDSIWLLMRDGAAAPVLIDRRPIR